MRSVTINVVHPFVAHNSFRRREVNEMEMNETDNFLIFFPSHRLRVLTEEI